MADVVIDTFSDIGAEMLTALNVNILADVMSALWVVIPALFEECGSFC